MRLRLCKSKTGIIMACILFITICLHNTRQFMILDDSTVNDPIIVNKNDIIRGNTLDNVEKSEVKIPILVYSLINKSDNLLNLSESGFRDQIKWMDDDGYTFLSMSEVYEMITTGKNIPQKPVAICFEDGYKSTYFNAYPILKEYGIKATIFLTSDRIEEPRYLSAGMILEMSKNNISFQSHGSSGVNLAMLTFDEQEEELKKSKDRIESICNNKVEFLMYPKGGFDNDTINAMSKLNYKMAIGKKYGYANEENGIYNINRIRVTSNMKNLDTFKSLIDGD